MPWSELVWASVVTVFFAIPMILTVVAVLDAARRPSWAWSLAERNQAMWIAMILFGLCSVIGGIAISVWYLLRIRPEIAAAESGQVRTRRRATG